MQPQAAVCTTLLGVPPPRVPQNSNPPWLHLCFSLSPLIYLWLQSMETIADNLLCLFSKTRNAMTLRNYLFSFHYFFSCSKILLLLFSTGQTHGNLSRHTVFLPHLIALAAPHFNSMKLPSITLSTAPCGEE